MDLIFVEELVKSKSWGAFENGDEWADGPSNPSILANANGQKQSDEQPQLLPTSEPYQRSAHNDAKMAAVLFCDVLGALCILLNAFVILALLRNRRRVLINVFYVLVLHCAIVDLIRGGCLIAWGMPHLLIHTMRTIDDRLNALKISQFTLVILRSCNLLTIFNLLVFTTNEFIVIKYPLHYRRYFCRRTVVCILALCWLVSLLFGIGSVFANLFAGSHSVMVKTNVSMEFYGQQNERGNKHQNEDEDEAVGIEGEDELLQTEDGPSGVKRRQMDGLSINVLFMLMIFVLCYVCLFTVLICYGKILKIIRQFQRHGADGRRRMLTISVGSQKNSPNATKRNGGGSIYHKRSLHQQRNDCYNQQQQQKQQKEFHGEGIKRMATKEMAEAEGSNGRMEEESVRKKVSMPGTPQSQSSQINCATNSDAEFVRSRRCNSHRKWRSHLMSRHKYLIVIGSVLFVDILFLFPYSGIQMVALLHLNNLLATSHLTTLIRWCLQILIGVHSVCQPLCYFRMTEFRRLACCLGETRRFGGSGSSAGGSIFGATTAGTISRVTKSNNKNDGTDELQPTTKRSIVLRTVVSRGIPPREMVTTLASPAGTQREQSTNWVNPTVDGQQMLLITQRRRWTRNLSLLCKEEGEELEMFLAKEYRRRTVKEYAKEESIEDEENRGEERKSQRI